MSVRYFFLLILMSLSLSTYAQRGASYIKPFQDYRNCSIGFINVLGDTVAQPQFDKVEYTPIKSSSPHVNYWIVSQGEKVGILSDIGQLIVPIKYDRVSPVRFGFFHTYLNQKMGIIDLNSNKEFLPTYDKIKKRTKDYYSIFENKKEGIIDTNFNVIIPPIYSKIEFIKNSVIGQKYPELLRFKVTDSTGVGTINSNGSIEIPPIYKTLYPTWIDHHCETAGLYYIATNAERYSGVLSYGGDTLVPFENTTIQIRHVNRDRCDSNTVSFAYIMNPKGRKVVNLTNGKSSGYHKMVYPFYHQTGYLDDDHQGVLNADMETLLDVNTGNLTTALGNVVAFGRTGTTYLSKLSSPSSEITVMDSVIFHFRPAVYKKKWFRKTELVDLGRRSIINYHSGASTPQDYQMIMLKKSGGITVYWAIKFDSLDWTQYRTNIEHPITLDIYSQDLEKINSIVFANDRSTVLKTMYRLDEPSRAIYTLQLLNGKMGAINEFGDTIIPFIHDEYLRSLRTSPGTLRVDYHIFKKQNKYGVYDYTGDITFPFDYDTIFLTNRGSYEFWKGDSIYSYDRNFTHLNTRPLIKPDKPIAKHDVRAPGDVYLKYYDLEEGYLNIDEHLYYRQPDSLILIDSTNTFFKDKRAFLDNHYLIDEGGNILLYAEEIINYHNTYFTFSKKKLKAYDRNGKLTLAYDKCLYNRFDGNHLIITSPSKKEGAVNTYTGKWLIEPDIYYNITPIYDELKIKPAYYWGLLEKSKKNSRSVWQLLDSKGQLMYGQTFDEMTNVFTFGSDIIKSNGLYGVFDDSCSIVVPTKYSYIQEFNKNYYLYKSGKWGIYREGKMLESQFDDVSTAHFFGGQLIYKDGLIAVIGNDLEFLLPFTDEETIMREVDLADLLEPKFEESDFTPIHISGSSHLGYEQPRYYSQQSQEPYQLPILPKCNDRVISNKRILRKSSGESTKGYFKEQLALSKKYKKENPNFLAQNSQVKKRIYNTMNYCDSNYYSEILRYDSLYYYPGLFRNNDTTIIQFNTYKISDNDLTLITLNDFLLDDVESQNQLDSIISKKIIEDQVFGIECVDLENIIQQFKHRFQLTYQGLSFYQADHYITSVTIPYEDLKGILRDERLIK